MLQYNQKYILINLVKGNPVSPRIIKLQFLSNKLEYIINYTIKLLSFKIIIIIVSILINILFKFN